MKVNKTFIFLKVWHSIAWNLHMEDRKEETFLSSPGISCIMLLTNNRQLLSTCHFLPERDSHTGHARVKPIFSHYCRVSGETGHTICSEFCPWKLNKWPCICKSLIHWWAHIAVLQGAKKKTQSERVCLSSKVEERMGPCSQHRADVPPATCFTWLNECSLYECVR